MGFWRRTRHALVLTALGGLTTTSPAQVASDIASDATLGTSVNQAGNVFDIDGGTVAGGVNLFHSFARFTVGTGDVANFNGPGSIQNVISRVTGGSQSTIDGTIGSTIANANLYLVNPAGVLFGPNSSLNVDGSFHVTSADFLGFQDGARFFSDPASGSTLSAAPVTSFGFLTATPAPITVESTAFTSAPGATLSIVGGQLTFGAADGSAPAYLNAPNAVDGGGQVVRSSIRIASVGSPGEATLGADGGIGLDGFSKLGGVRFQGSSFVDGGNVVVRGARVEISDATILPGAFSVFDPAVVPPDGGFVDIAATEAIEIAGSAPDPFFEAPTGVLVFAGLNPSFASARVPDVRLSAASISMSGPSGVTVNRFAQGDAGTVRIDAGTLTIRNGASVSLVNSFAGLGGSLNVNAREVVLDGTGSTSFTGFAAQAALNSEYLASSIDPALTFAASGTIDVTASERLSVLGGAEISTDSRSFGPSGNITLRVGEALIDGGKIAAQSSFAGDSGNVTLVADGGVAISGGAIVSAATFGGGQGGNVNLSAGREVVISGERSGIASQTTPLPEPELDAFAALFLGAGATLSDLAVALGLAPASDLFTVLRALNDAGLTAIPEAELTPGDGGAINVVTPSLHLSGLNAAIDSSTATDGNAGNVNVTTTTLEVGSGATIGSRSGVPDLDTGELFVGAGRAGEVIVNAAGDVTVTGADATISTDTRGTGDAGNISIAANRLQIADGGKISSSSRGTGLAGDIRITLGDSLQIDAGSIATEAITSDGGNISITTPRLVELINGRITTSVGSGQGNGGNIFIDPDFVVLQSSRIIANAFGGAGGNIDIIAGFLIVSPDSVIDASSALGVDGFVRTTAPDSDVSAALAVLPSSYLDAASKLQAGCGAARTGQSSLAQVGRGGLPAPPGDYLASGFESISTAARVSLHDAASNASPTDATLCSL